MRCVILLIVMLIITPTIAYAEDLQMQVAMGDNQMIGGITGDIQTGYLWPLIEEGVTRALDIYIATAAGIFNVFTITLSFAGLFLFFCRRRRDDGREEIQRV